MTTLNVMLARTAAPQATPPSSNDAAVRFPHTREAVSFAVIGLLCTVLFAVAYQFLRGWFPPLTANGLALSTTAGLNFTLNRQYTFPSRRGPLPNQAARYGLFYLLGLGVSSLALWTFLRTWSAPPQFVELGAALASSGLATAVRFVTMSFWVFPARTS